MQFSSKFLFGICCLICASDFSKGNTDDDNKLRLQTEFSSLFSPDISPKDESQVSLAMNSLSASQAQRYANVLKLLPNDQPFLFMNKPHKSAFNNLLEIFRECPTESDLLTTARILRDDPKLNKKLWVASFIAATLDRKEFRELTRPHLMWLFPDAIIAPRDNKACVPVDETVGIENGLENRLWYFREDFLANAQHLFWHLSHDHKITTPIRGDREGELFYYFHQNILARYDAERLSNGLARTMPLNYQERAVVNLGYNPHLMDPVTRFKYNPRPAGTILTGVSTNVQFASILRRDIESRFLLAGNGSLVSLQNIKGVDFLGDLIEASLKSLNTNRYSSQGIHNTGHGHLSALSHQDFEQPKPEMGVMLNPSVSMRDPIFYQWHKYIDDIFYRQNVLLPPYTLRGGEFPLLWDGVSVESISVNFVDKTKQQVPNVLTTNFKTINVALPITQDIFLSNETIDYCMKRLEYEEFAYTIGIMKGHSGRQKATVRIFMAPRYNEAGQRFSLMEQNRLFFAMDVFTVDLSLGYNSISRKSSESTLLLHWTLENWMDSPPSFESPNCGCGWPNNLLLPKGTTTGMLFDLFVMTTDAAVDTPIQNLQNGEDGCKMGQIFCGVEDAKYPDVRPMGFPLDRRPLVVPTPGGGARYVDDLDELVSFLPNAATIQVTIRHEQ